jgi:hypothetical protein
MKKNPPLNSLSPFKLLLSIALFPYFKLNAQVSDSTCNTLDSFYQTIETGSDNNEKVKVRKYNRKTGKFDFVSNLIRFDNKNGGADSAYSSVTKLVYVSVNPSVGNSYNIYVPSINFRYVGRINIPIKPKLNNNLFTTQTGI